MKPFLRKTDKNETAFMLCKAKKKEEKKHKTLKIIWTKHRQLQIQQASFFQDSICSKSQINKKCWWLLQNRLQKNDDCEAEDAKLGWKEEAKALCNTEKRKRGQAGRRHISGKTVFPFPFFPPLLSSLRGIPHVSGIMLFKQVHTEGCGCGKNITMRQHHFHYKSITVSLIKHTIPTVRLTH